MENNTIIAELSQVFTKQAKLLFISMLVLIIIDVFVYSLYTDIRLLAIVVAYFIFSFHYKISSKITFTLLLVITLALIVLFLLVGASVEVERIAVWFVLLMLLGIIQQWRELSK